jgi:hypothetical protein
MPFAVTQLPDEPIVIVKIELPIDQYLACTLSVNAQLARLAAESRTTLFVLVDVSDLAPSFSDVLIGLDTLKEQGSWIKQRQARGILVGTHPMINIAAKRLGQQFNVEMACFPTLQEALDYARAQQIASGDALDGEE